MLLPLWGQKHLVRLLLPLQLDLSVALKSIDIFRPPLNASQRVRTQHHSALPLNRVSLG